MNKYKSIQIRKGCFGVKNENSKYPAPYNRLKMTFETREKAEKYIAFLKEREENSFKQNYRCKKKENNFGFFFLNFSKLNLS